MFRTTISIPSEHVALYTRARHRINVSAVAVAAIVDALNAAERAAVADAVATLADAGIVLSDAQRAAVAAHVADHVG